MLRFSRKSKSEKTKTRAVAVASVGGAWICEKPTDDEKSELAESWSGCGIGEKG
jgi:hypothetical protein